MCPAASCGVSCWCLKSIRVGTSRASSSATSSRPSGSGKDSTVSPAVVCGMVATSTPARMPVRATAACSVSVTSCGPLPGVRKR